MNLANDILGVNKQTAGGILRVKISKKCAIKFFLLRPHFQENMVKFEHVTQLRTGLMREYTTFSNLLFSKTKYLTKRLYSTFCSYFHM